MSGKQFATLVVVTFIVGMIWLISDVIFNTKASIPISDKLQTLLEPTNPNFDARVLKTIDEETVDTDSVVQALPEPLPLTTPTPSPSPIPSGPPSAPASSTNPTASPPPIQPSPLPPII